MAGLPTGRRIEPSRSRQEQNTYRYGRGRCGRHFAQLPHLEHRRQIENAYVVVRKLGKANDEECVAAAFILHGPLIIGGGAALKPRVEKSFGPDATNVFEQVIGMERGGRSARRKEFIDLYDTLLDTNTNDSGKVQPTDERFRKIVEASGQFMDLNNLMMLAVRQRPWWTKYVAAVGAAVISAVVWRFVAGQSPVSPTKTK